LCFPGGLDPLLVVLVVVVDALDVLLDDDVDALVVVAVVTPDR
jgi:hypothetical protein